MIEALKSPWPWYVAGPLIGLVVPALLLLGNRQFGISGNLRHLCAAVLPRRPDFLRYDWKKAGGWNLLFAGGIVGGGAIGTFLLRHPDPIAISDSTRAWLASLSIPHEPGLLPMPPFDFASLGTLAGFVVVIVGGFLIGFGARYAGGCTSGHAITGLSALSLPSLIAVVGFFAGGLFSSHVLLPLLFGGAS